MTVLPRDDRLHPRSRVRDTIRQGKRVRSGSLVLHFVADSSTQQAAVVVGKGFAGAVQRHRRQRQVRHALAASWDKVPGGSLVVRALPSQDPYEVLSRDLAKALTRL